ncbi:hypothetical protein ACLKA7_010281 [Drosophila subpalustris]
MRAILFFFYTIETILNLFTIRYHVGTFMNLPEKQDLLKEELQQYIFSVIFQFLTILTLFSSISICTGNLPKPWLEAIRTGVGSICNIILSLATMVDAENSASRNFIQTKVKVHPYFMYMRGQSICALLSGALNLLHCTIVIDIMLSHEMSNDKDDIELDLIVPINLYIGSEWIERRLEKYEWFQVINDKRRVSL